MRLSVLILILFNSIACVYSQVFSLKDINISGKVQEKISKTLDVGEDVVLTGFIKIEYSYFLVIESSKSRENISVKDIAKLNLQPRNIKEFWQIKCIENETYINLLKNGYQYDLRKELEEEELDFMARVKSADLVFNDAYLESYISTLIYRIFPFDKIDQRPGNLNVTILKDPHPNAFIFPNGTMIINSGLLSLVNSEEELIGILSHEIAHFVLDHSVININKEVQRKKRAEFWAGFATAIAGATDIFLATRNDYYVPGVLTGATAIISFSAASAITERMGINYSKDQEFLADKCATELMDFLQINPKLLAFTFDKLKLHAIVTGNYVALMSGGTHPSLNERVKKIGDREQFLSLDYDVRVSFVNTFNAVSHFNSRNFLAAKALIERNIASGVATEEDYVLLGALLLKLRDDKESNLQAYHYLKEALSLRVWPSINTYKYLSIANIRLGKKEEAYENLLSYKKALEKELQPELNRNLSKAFENYIVENLEWASKMLYKVQKI